MKKPAFTLVEILTVLAIISILMSAAMPVYKTHMLRAKIAENLEYQRRLIYEQVQTYYNTKGTVPNTITYGSTTITVNAGWTQITDGGDVQFIWYGKEASNAWVGLGFILKNLTGIPGYVTPTTTAPTAFSAVDWGIRITNGVMMMACGQAAPGDTAYKIPFRYLPAGCQCTNVNGFRTGAFVC